MNECHFKALFGVSCQGSRFICVHSLVDDVHCSADTSLEFGRSRVG